MESGVLICKTASTAFIIYYQLRRDEWNHIGPMCENVLHGRNVLKL